MPETKQVNSALNSYYIDDHALLFAFLARAVLDMGPVSGLQIIEQWVTLYGRERGARSAMRCMGDGEPLTVLNYFAYSEWHDEKGWNVNKIVSTSPYHFHTTSCGWCESWKKHGLMDYGKLYCRWVDPALVHGFNPDLLLEMPGTLSGGNGYCDFLWPGSSLSQDELEALATRRAGLIKTVTRDFLYHCAHLYNALERVLLDKLEENDAGRVLRQGLQDYADLFGRDKADSILAASGRGVVCLDPF